MSSRSATTSSSKSANRTPFRTTAKSCSSWLIPLSLIIGIILIFAVWYGYNCQRQSSSNNVISKLVGGQNSPDTVSSQYPPGQVHELLPEHLLSLMKKGTVVVAFMSDSCGHCTQLKPKYHQAARMSNIPLFSLMAHQPGSEDLIRMCQVTGFPTIVMLENGQMKQYNGNRTPEDIANFANKK